MDKDGEENFMYDLYGVLVHAGNYASSGHYYSFIKASNGAWYEMNDSSVQQIGIKRALNQQAYILFYQKRVVRVEKKIQTKTLKRLLSDNIENTFNSISVDSDTSTSDTLTLFSINKPIINFDIKENYDKLSYALNTLMKDLSLQIVKDGEGLSKLISVKVINSKSKIDAKNIAFSVINSPLVKTAISGEDPNWGRIIMAIGKSGEKISPDKIEIKFGELKVAEKGRISEEYNEEKLKEYMKWDDLLIEVNLKIGHGSFECYTCDLTNEYININADYRN